MKTDGTSGEVWGESPPLSANLSGMRKKGIRLAWDQETLGAVPRCPTTLLLGRIKVIRSPVKRKDLGASPSLAATLCP